MARIGIYGGTFNPIHKTHIEIAEAAYKQFNLSKVVFLLSGDPPHKKIKSGVTAFNRLDMLNIAISDIDYFEIDDRELLRSTKSYSYLTIEEYSREYRDDELFFIMGSDSLLNFENWVNPDIISDHCTILGAPRSGDNIEDINSCINHLNYKFSGKFALIDYAANDVASSSIRDYLKANRSCENINSSVLDYILAHDLYNFIYDEADIQRLSANMEKALKKSRFIHTIGVANTAYNLAINYNYPAYNAMVAGLLHDCAKCISDDKRIEECQKHNIEISEVEYKYPHLLHGKVGAIYCKEKYNIFDSSIAHAIAVHTTGCIDMSLLDKIIFVADYIEPGRAKQPRLDLLRKIAYEDLDLCVFMILEDTVNYLNETPDSIDKTTLLTYEYYKNERYR